MNTFLTILAVLIIAWGWTLVCLVCQAKDNLAGVLKSPSSGAHRLSGKSSMVPRQASGAPAQAARHHIPNTEQLAKGVPGCSQGDAAPEGPGTPVNKPLMRKPRGPMMSRPSAKGILPGTLLTVMLEPGMPWIDYADPGLPDEPVDHALARWLAISKGVRLV